MLLTLSADTCTHVGLTRNLNLREGPLLSGLRILGLSSCQSISFEQLIFGATYSSGQDKVNVCPIHVHVHVRATK